MTGGTVVVNGPANTATGHWTSTATSPSDGGTLVAAGSAGMVVSPSADSTQGWVSATLDSAVEAGHGDPDRERRQRGDRHLHDLKAVQNVVVSTADISVRRGVLDLHRRHRIGPHRSVARRHPARSARPPRSPRSPPAKHRPAGWVAVVVPAEVGVLPGTPVGAPGRLEPAQQRQPDVHDLSDRLRRNRPQGHHQLVPEQVEGQVEHPGRATPSRPRAGCRNRHPGVGDLDQPPVGPGPLRLRVAVRKSRSRSTVPCFDLTLPSCAGGPLETIRTAPHRDLKIRAIAAAVLHG